MVLRKYNRQFEAIKAEERRRDKETNDRAIAEANRRAAEATQKAEEERLARVKLESKLADRRLTYEQSAKVMICGAVCVVCAAILLLHVWLPLWQAFGIAGVVILKPPAGLKSAES